MAELANSTVPVENLGALLLDEGNSIEVRLQAAKDLGEKQQLEVVPVLGKALLEAEEVIVRRQCVSFLEKPSLIIVAIPYLIKALNDADQIVKNSASYALGTAVEQTNLLFQSEVDGQQEQGKAATDSLGTPIIGKVLTSDERQGVRQSAATLLGQTRDLAAIPYLRQSLQKDTDVGVLFNAISALGLIGTAAVVPILGETLRNDANETIQKAAAGALAKLAHPDGIPYLAASLVGALNLGIRQAAEAALEKFPHWQLKTEQILESLAENHLERTTIDAVSIIRAVRPAAAQDKLLLMDFLISNALDRDTRMTSVIAALLIASADGSLSVAGERINRYQESAKIPTEKLRLLRIEVGGHVALDPLLNVLKENLKENFQEPIKKLNDDTQRMWTETIRHAQQGFRVRIIMSVVTFGIGVALVVASFLMVVFGNLEAEALVGTAVSFGTGIITMLLTVYSGPLKEIRRSVSDLGIASAAFIAFIHQVLEISHTFSFYYLNQQITFDIMQESSGLINEAMKNTIQLLEDKKT
jgi:hypothetical protein